MTNVLKKDVEPKPISELIEKIVARYKTDSAYLKTALFLTEPTVNNIQNPIGSCLLGKFDIEENYYLTGELKHISMTETHLCGSQMSLLLIGYLLERGYVSEWGAYDFSNYFGTALTNRSENLFIVEIHSTFVRQIVHGKGLEGTLTIVNASRTKNNNYCLDMVFDLEKGAHICKFKFVMLLDQKK